MYILEYRHESMVFFFKVERPSYVMSLNRVLTAAADQTAGCNFPDKFRFSEIGGSSVHIHTHTYFI